MHLSFLHHIFTLCFNQLQHLHFVCHQAMLWMLFSSFLYVTFLTSICEITYVPRGFWTNDVGWFAVNWPQHCTTVLQKTTDMCCYLYIWRASRKSTRTDKFWKIRAWVKNSDVTDSVPHCWSETDTINPLQSVAAVCNFSSPICMDCCDCNVP